MSIFRRKFVKCFLCKNKEDVQKAYVVKYKANDGMGSSYVCRTCADELDVLSSNIKDLYNDD